MKYSKQHQILWHDTDANRRMRPSQILVYMQETSNHHVASAGMTLDELRDDKHLAFILSKLRLRVYRRPLAFENVTVQTWTIASRGISTGRCFRMLCGDEVVAEADSTWALLGTEDRAFHRIEETEYEFEHEEPIELGMPNRIRFASDLRWERVGERPIVYSDLDYNMHMNNTRYPDMLCDYLPLEEIPRIRGFLLSYLHEAAYGDTVTVWSAKQDDCYYFKTVNQAGTVCLEAQLLL